MGGKNVKRKHRKQSYAKKREFHPPCQYFTIELSYEGREHDELIYEASNRILGIKYGDCSGYDFTTYRRDHMWRVDDKTKANKLARALARLDLPKPCVVIQAPGKILVQP